MAKFNQGNLVLTSSQKLIQGGDTLIDANGVASLTSLALSGGLEVLGVSDLFSLNVNDLAEIDSLEVTGTANFSTVSATGAIDGASITVATGATIVEFSTDETLSGNSDTVVPTEKAVKAYVDSQISSIGSHNSLSGLQGGEVGEYYHLKQDIYDSLFTSGTAVGFGDSTGVNIIVDQDSNTVPIKDSVTTIALFRDSEVEFFPPEDGTAVVVITPDGVTGAVWG